MGSVSRRRIAPRAWVCGVALASLCGCGATLSGDPAKDYLPAKTDTRIGDFQLRLPQGFREISDPDPVAGLEKKVYNGRRHGKYKAELAIAAAPRSDGFGPVDWSAIVPAATAEMRKVCRSFSSNSMPTTINGNSGQRVEFRGTTKDGDTVQGVMIFLSSSTTIVSLVFDDLGADAADSCRRFEATLATLRRTDQPYHAAAVELATAAASPAPAASTDAAASAPPPAAATPPAPIAEPRSAPPAPPPTDVAEFRFGEIKLAIDGEDVDPNADPHQAARDRHRRMTEAGANGSDDRWNEGMPDKSDPKYYVKLAEMVKQRHGLDTDRAIGILLDTEPETVDGETRKVVARAFRDALAEHSLGDTEELVRGLVLWGGKYSVSALVNIIQSSRFMVDASLLQALADSGDPSGAECLAAQLGNFHNRNDAERALRNMGPIAEDALIAAVPSTNPEISGRSIVILGDLGTEKCLDVLRRAKRSKNREIVEAATDALRRVQSRTGSPGL